MGVNAVTYRDLGPKEKYYTDVAYNDLRTITAGTVIQEEDEIGVERVALDTTNNRIVRLKFVNVTATGTAPANVAVGNALHWLDTARTKVTTDQTDAVGGLNSVAGIGFAAITKGNRGWILIEGQATLTSQGGVTHGAGDACIASTTDLLVNKTAANTAPTNQVIGFCNAAGSGAGGTVSVYVKIQ